MQNQCLLRFQKLVQHLKLVILFLIDPNIFHLLYHQMQALLLKNQLKQLKVFDPVTLIHKFLLCCKLKIFVEHIEELSLEYFYQYDNVDYLQQQHLNPKTLKTPKRH